MIYTTIGNLVTAFYEEALKEFGDEEVAREVASILIGKHIQKNALRSYK